VAFVAALGLVSAGTPAFATDTTFVARQYHANGAVLVVAVQGDITWLNRSVTLNNVQIWVRQGYCGNVVFRGQSSSNPNIDTEFLPGPTYKDKWCGIFDSSWHTIGNITLDGSQIVGGIRTVLVAAREVDTDGDLVQQGGDYDGVR